MSIFKETPKPIWCALAFFGVAVTVSAAGALYGGSLTTAQDPVPATPNSKMPCNVHPHATENACPTLP